MDRKPLVITDGETQQLQAGDDLDIPLDDRVAELERKLSLLVTYLIESGTEVPLELYGE